MTDIVEQLRDLQSGAQWVCGETAATLSDAADEIEQLRKDNAELLILVDMTRDAAMGHQERAERMRAALHRISLASQDSGTTKEFLGKEARAALREDMT